MLVTLKEDFMENDSATQQWAVVTGASSGIGYELAKEFARNGFNLLVVAEDPGIVEAAQAFRELGVEAESIQADLATYDGVEKLYAHIRSMGHPLEAIAINAGVGVGGASFDKTDLAEELNLIALNVTSTVHLTKRILPDMIAAGHGRILFTSSIAALMPGPFESVYSASKAFVQSFAEAIRQEVKDKGITVTSLMPGPTDTNFFHRAGMDETKVGDKSKDDASLVARQGFEALMAGTDKVIAGSAMTKAQAHVAQVLPQSVGAKMHEGMTKPR
jgi:short-subunit dehydrogenase